jgi:hypothetical protein
MRLWNAMVRVFQELRSSAEEQEPPQGLPLVPWNDILDNPASRGLLFEMLNDLCAWRSRAMDQIQLSDAQWSERSRNIEVRALSEVTSLYQFLESLPRAVDGSVRIILPLGEFSKEPLHYFHATVADHHVHRMSRKDTGKLQAAYFSHLAQKAGIGTPSPELVTFLEHIFTFRPSVWRKIRKIGSDPLWRFFEKMEIDDQVQRVSYDQWKRKSVDQIEPLVRRHAISCSTSSVEHPLLALPSFLPENPTSRIEDLLDELYQLLTDAEAKSRLHPQPAPNKRFADRLVSTYCAYGRRWEALAVCTVPLDNPFTIQVREKREISFQSPRRQGPRAVSAFIDPMTSKARHYVSFRDADSNYVHISSPDMHVHFRRLKCIVKDELWRDLQGQPDDERKEVEYYTRYDSKPERAERIWITCALRQNRLRSAMTLGVFLATISAWCLLMNFGVWDYQPEARLNGADVVALLLPVTFAASLLLARESSTLGMRVKRLKQSFLALALAMLWGTTVWLYALGHIVIDTLHQN